MAETGESHPSRLCLEEEAQHPGAEVRAHWSLTCHRAELWRARRIGGSSGCVGLKLVHMFWSLTCRPVDVQRALWWGHTCENYHRT